MVRTAALVRHVARSNNDSSAPDRLPHEAARKGGHQVLRHHHQRRIYTHPWRGRPPIWPPRPCFHVEVASGALYAAESLEGWEMRKEKAESRDQRKPWRWPSRKASPSTNYSFPGWNPIVVAMVPLTALDPCADSFCSGDTWACALECLAWLIGPLGKSVTATSAACSA